MRIAVTGAGGFIGRAMVARLEAIGHDVIPVVRKREGLDKECPIEISDATDWTTILSGVDAVVHLAGRSTAPNDSTDDLTFFRMANVVSTFNLARQAIETGVRRFLFMSSIKVNGETTEIGRPFRPTDRPRPEDAYGVSKFEAEQELERLKARGMEFVVIRPPLVYGLAASGNFAALQRWVARGLPLPFGSITDNLRSFIGVDNLVDFSTMCLFHPLAADKLYLVSDDHDLSTRALVELMSKAAGRRPRLFPVPTGILAGAVHLVGKQAMARRFLGNLQVDLRETKQELGWAPPVSVENGLKRAMETDRPSQRPTANA